MVGIQLRECSRTRPLTQVQRQAKRNNQTIESSIAPSRFSRDIDKYISIRLTHDVKYIFYIINNIVFTIRSGHMYNYNLYICKYI